MYVASGMRLAGGRRPRAADPGAGAPARGLLQIAIVSLIAGLAVAVAQLIEPFDHGVWLVAYLLLVGSLAPYLLGLGEAALSGGRLSARGAHRQTALWAAATVIVPLGVFAESRAAVAVGSGALLLALLSIGSATLRDRRRHGPERRLLVGAYAGLLGFMALSACTGLALAWDLPWL